MTKEELKNKYTAFITEISEILGLGKPIDIIKLCATTDLFFQPLEKKIEELEKENAEMKKSCQIQVDSAFELLEEKENTIHTLDVLHKEAVRKYGEVSDQLTKAKIFIKDYMIIASDITACGVPEENRSINVLKLNEQAEQFLKEIDQ